MIQHTAQSDVSVQVNVLKTPQSVVRIPRWISIIVILGAVLTAVGAVISKVDPTILTNGGPITDAARVYADYLFARNLSLAVMLLLLLAIRNCFGMRGGNAAWPKEQDRRSFLWVHLLYFWGGGTQPFKDQTTEPHP